MKFLKVSSVSLYLNNPLDLVPNQIAPKLSLKIVLTVILVLPSVWLFKKSKLFIMLTLSSYKGVSDLLI